MSLRRVASEVKARLSALGNVATRDSARRYLRGEGGAIAIYFGLTIIVFVGVAGLAVDAARGYLVKARLSEAIDAAALAGGKALQASNDKDNVKVKADALAFFNANFPNGAMGATVTPPTITIGNNNSGLTATTAEDVITIAVRDTGIGIAPEDQAAIYEEFRQVGREDARKQEGTGLGLTLAKKFVELHGGRIWVSRSTGPGTTFEFSLPAGVSPEPN